MKKIKKLIKTIHDATRQYDVPPEHAFSRQSMADQAVIAEAALATETANQERQSPVGHAPMNGTLAT
jgi:hypothetical protein